jgi:hypothetical protein
MVKSNPTGEFEPSNPLCRFLSTTNQHQKAVVIRILLESYKPFKIFRDRLTSTGLVVDAARQVKSILGLTEHHSDISTSLLSLGTYSQAVRTSGSGHYEIVDVAGANLLEHLICGISDIAKSEALVMRQIGTDAAGWISREHVITPLAEAMRRAEGGDSRGAVVQGGNAIESYLIELSSKYPVQLNGTGINAKLDELKRADKSKMPTKLCNMGKYLGHVRNAADHGTDSDIGAPWGIRPSTGIEYVFVACSFVAASTALVFGRIPEI